MDFKKLALATMVAGALAGCNSSDDNNSGGDNPPVAPPPIENPIQISSYRVIDGYLNNAEVCVYPPKVHASVDHCIPLDYKTGEKGGDGHIDIPEHLQGGTVVARIIAGETVDKDTVGFVGRSYEMVSVPGSEVITPFTTIAHVEGKSIEDVANSMNLPVSLVAGDYVAAKDNDAEIDPYGENDAQRAHLVARTMADQLARNINENNDELTSLATTVNDAINKLDPETDLNRISFEISGKEDIEEYPRVAGLGDFFLEKPITTRYMGSMNPGFANSEIITRMEIHQAEKVVCDFDHPDRDRPQYEQDTNIPCSEGYSDWDYYTDDIFEGNSLATCEEGDIVDGEECEGDKAIYISNEMLLAVPFVGQGQDVLIYTTYDYSGHDSWEDWSETKFWNPETGQGATWHKVNDGGYTANGLGYTPTHTELQFTSDSEGLALVRTYQGNGIFDQFGYAFDWEVDGEGRLSITDPQGESIKYARGQGNRDIHLAIRAEDAITERVPSLMTLESGVAERIIDDWIEAADF